MIKIVDYGLGNIKAFANVYKKLNVDFQFANTPEQLKKADKLILPGVGAFDHAMGRLNDSGLRDTLDELVLEHKVPIIGICVGMQMMADTSEEGIEKGLGWITGKVKSFKNHSPLLFKDYPLPHMGWNNLALITEHPLTRNLKPDNLFYFLHSYYFEPSDTDTILATADYGLNFSCVINKANIYGIQCHPEKSHHNGVTLLKNFASL